MSSTTSRPANAARTAAAVVLACVAAAAQLRAAPAHDPPASVLTLTPSTEHGATLFTTCAACHGPEAAGSKDGIVPVIAHQHFAVLVRQLLAFRRHERWDVAMEQVSSTHSLPDSQAVVDVAAYISALPEASSAPVRAASAAGSAPPSPSGAAPPSTDAARLYAQRCANCHGAAGEGSAERSVPFLAGQHEPYLLRQMHDAVDGRRPGFAGDHVAPLASLARDDLVALAHYLSSGFSAPPDGARGP
jgi:cytochrome c553